MQIQPVIMRLLVILSVATVIVGTAVHAGTVASPTVVSYAGDVAGGGVVEVANSGGAVLVLKRPTAGARNGTNQVLLPRPRSIQSGGGMLTRADSSEKNVYRTKMSKLKIILLADMLNDIPPQMELITCLANSSSLNVTTKHCACERYSCKDLLSSSSSSSSSSASSSPFNSVNQRKIHTSCGDYCCRKKKFNRSIDPSIQNAVAAAVRHNSFAPPASRVQVTDPRPTLASSSSHIPKLASRWRRTCEGGTVVDQIAISSERDSNGSGQRSGTHSQHQNLRQSGGGHFQLPWLYRVILIEKELTICAGTLIHPSVLLTTAVCVINKNPDELIVRRQPTESSGRRTSPDQPAVEAETETELARAVQRILIPDQFATTFERLENNVALLVLQPIKVKQHPQESFPSSIDEGGSIFKQVFGSRTPGIITKSGLVNVGQLSYPFEETSSLQEEDKQKHREPSYICLSSIINHASAPVESSVCQIFSWRKPVRKSVASNSSTSLVGQRPRGQRRQQRPRRRQRRQQQNQSQIRTGDDGTNYITANISIFPATSLDGSDDDSGQQCRREHRDYLQHQGNLCAGPADKSRTLDVDLSGSPLLCTATSPSSGVTRVELRGILTWSTDINRAPHLFTNITTYRGWIESELDKLDLQLELTRSVAGAGRRRRRQSGTGS
ncbi:uncharacterized protein LOC6040790 [Culex quinquefasciatus]|uniref:uncharacterized protein LOC6040790 n=1 Tax=Culex quinquefasciatus TaxID=7176 RepID=UPI0018E393ED|nr:uncharacterized protein LOC6040790 [Culex quinquefasciatus]